jgi:acetyltransferase-like isoleucine patch superfamily enzyme
MDESTLPNLTELFRSLHPVHAAFLDALISPYDYWYPVDAAGEADISKAKTLYADFQKRLGDDELTGAMPYMRFQPVKGVEEHMLLTAFDPELHSCLDVKDEDDFRNKRRAMGPTHPEIRTFGSVSFFGGLESNFDHRSVIHGPLYAGHRCTVRASAKIIGPSHLGARTLLNTSSVFTRSIMGDDSQVDDLAVIKDSLIGCGVYIMPGAKLLHRVGLNGATIEVTDERESASARLPVRLKRPKMGCVIGDGCIIGADAVLGAGTILLPNVRIPHGLIVPSGIYDQAAIDRRSVHGA